jgi:hypothetical protein
VDSRPDGRAREGLPSTFSQVRRVLSNRSTALMSRSARILRSLRGCATVRWIGGRRRVHINVQTQIGTNVGRIAVPISVVILRA